jgi:acyl-CoA thioesterase
LKYKKGEMMMKAVIDESELHHQHKEVIIQALKKDAYANHLGIQLIEVGEGTAIAELNAEAYMLNAHGTLHGAVTFAIADYVFAAACNSYGRTAVALTNTINYMAAGKEGALIRATAEEVKKNYRTAWYTIKVESDGELIATMDATAYRLGHYFVPVEEEF